MCVYVFVSVYVHLCAGPCGGQNWALVPWSSSYSQVWVAFKEIICAPSRDREPGWGRAQHCWLQGYTVQEQIQAEESGTWRLKKD